MWYIVLFAALLGADQLIKYWTVEHLALGESAAFLPGIVRLTRVHNYGAAWSSFSGQTTALAVVTVLLMQVSAEWLVRMVSGSSEALVLENGARYLLVRRIVRHPLGVIAGVMILAGGVGNLIDRLFRGYVVDMFDLTLFSYPVFNFADCCVVVGAILGAVYYLFFYDKYDKRERPHGNDTPDGDK